MNARTLSLLPLAKSTQALSLILSLVCLPVFGQKTVQKRARYEYSLDRPVYVDSLLGELTYPLAWGNSPVTDFSQWRREARAKVRECMLMPPKAAAPRMEVVAEEQRDGYTARKITFWQNAYARVTAYLLVPNTPGRHPAVNVLHDHGGHLFIGKEKMVRPIGETQDVVDDAEAWVAKLYDGHYLGDRLAREGYVVLATDAPLWGDRGRKEGVDRKKYDLIAGNMMMLGRDLSAWMTYDDIAATELLASLPEVDSTRVGCVGFSMGGYRSWMLAALSDRIKASVAVCWMTTTEAQFASWRQRAENGGFANCLPGMRQWLDYPHIAAMACPNAMLLISGDSDKLFAPEGIKDAFQTLHATWQSQGADTRLTTELWPMGHECGEKVQQRLMEWLKNNL